MRKQEIVQRRKKMSTKIINIEKLIRDMNTDIGEMRGYLKKDKDRRITEQVFDNFRMMGKAPLSNTIKYLLVH